MASIWNKLTNLVSEGVEAVKEVDNSRYVQEKQIWTGLLNVTSVISLGGLVLTVGTGLVGLGRCMEGNLSGGLSLLTKSAFAAWIAYNSLKISENAKSIAETPSAFITKQGLGKNWDEEKFKTQLGKDLFYFKPVVDMVASIVLSALKRS